MDNTENNKLNEEQYHDGETTPIEYPEKAGSEGEDDRDSQYKLRGYKVVCAKLGASMSIYFFFRLLISLFSEHLFRATSHLGETAQSVIHGILLITVVYVIPLLITALIFNSFKNYKGRYRELYKKPRRFARAMGTFPATFGFGHGIALLTLLASFLLSRWLGGETLIEDLLRPTTVEPTTNIAALIMMVFMMVIIAPLFEEIWTRGIMYDALKPYGTGMAIIISSVIFGLMHGSLAMLFYTTAYGFALGYIRYATDSLLIVTIFHAIINSIAAGTLILLTLAELTEYQYRIINTVVNLYLVAVVVLIIIGVVVFLSKIRAIRKYKFENSWKDIGGWKKMGWFLVSVPVILMMVLAVNEHIGTLLVNLLLNAIN